MKIFYIANARIPTEKAHSIQIMEMCNAFTSHGEVELIVPRRFNQIKKDPFEYYGLDKKFKITRLPCIDLIPLNLGNLSFWIQTFSFLLVARIYLFFKRWDVLYTREKFVGLFFKNYIFEAHSLPARINLVHKKLWARARKIVVLTNILKSKLCDVGISAEKIFVSPDGVDVEKFYIDETKKECRRKLNLPQGKKIALYAGHLFDWKGTDVLLESAQYLDDDYLVVFVGGTEGDLKKYELKLAHCGFKNRIRIIGRKPHRLIPFFLKAADVLILPHRRGSDEFFASPLKLFEYMASKKPIIASDTPSLREILDEGCAILVQPDDPEVLAGAIRRALSNSELCEKIARKAFEKVKNYSWRNRAEKIINFIE
jgi:glycosyltransferase involved in cell wall biosynthesis